MNENDLRKIKLLFFFLLFFFAMAAGVFKQLQQINEEEIIRKKEQEEQEAILDGIKNLQKSLEEQEQIKTIARQEQIPVKPEIIEEGETVLEEQNNEEEAGNVMDASEAMELGLQEQKSGNFKKAIEYFETASKSPDKKIQRAAYKNIIDCYTELNDTYGKIEIYQNMISAESDEYVLKRIYEKLAEEYGIVENFEKALEFYQKSYQLEPTSAKALAMCDIYKKINKPEDMEDLISRHVKKFPQDKSLFAKYNQTAD